MKLFDICKKCPHGKLQDRYWLKAHRVVWCNTIGYNIHEEENFGGSYARSEFKHFPANVFQYCDNKQIHTALKLEKI